MIENLFDLPESKSPRLKWIEKHHLQTHQTPNWQPDTEDEFCDVVEAWYASDDNFEHNHGGETEDEALVAWAKARGKLTWMEEGKL